MNLVLYFASVNVPMDGIACVHTMTSMLLNTHACEVDENQYCSKNVATLGATNFTLSTRGSYKLGGESTICTSKSDGLPVVNI